MPAEIFKLANPQITWFKYGSKLLTLLNILTFGFCFKKNSSIFDISPIIWNSILGYILLDGESENDLPENESDNTETKEIFNWEPIPFEKTILDCARSIENQIWF